MTIKDKEYYADLLEEVAHEYDEEEKLIRAIREERLSYGIDLMDEIDAANEYAFGRYTVDEYEYAREFIESTFEEIFEEE